MFDKPTIRHSILAQRKQLASDFVSIASQLITRKVISSAVFKKSQHVACYLSNDNEVSTHEIISKAILDEKHIYIPVFTANKTIAFYLLDKKTVLIKNKYGIEEPDISNQLPVLPETLDLILLPLVAFDAEGNRLGRGAGAYDRYLQFTKTLPVGQRPYLMGLAYDFQKVDKIIAESWDVPLDAVITEEGD